MKKDERFTEQQRRRHRSDSRKKMTQAHLLCELVDAVEELSVAQDKTIKAGAKKISTAIKEGFTLVADKLAIPVPPPPDLRSKQLNLVRLQDLDTGLTVEGAITKMQITDSQQVTIEFGAPVDKKGFPAKVQDGSVSFSVSDSSATVEQDATNPFKATVKGASPSPVDADGLTVAGTVSISADADLGDGVTTISGAEPLLVTGGQASGFGAAIVGTPEDQA